MFDYPVMLFKMFLPKKEQTLHFTEIGWTITLPKGFDLLTAKKAQKMTSNEKLVIETLTEHKVNYTGENKFVAVYELENIFSCDFTNLQNLPEMVWQKQVNDVQNDMVTAFNAAYKDYAYVTITTEADARQKGNIVFNTFEITVKSQQRELKRVRYFTTVYKDYGILITMNFNETAVGEKMLDALRKSNFAA